MPFTPDKFPPQEPSAVTNAFHAKVSSFKPDKIQPAPERANFPDQASYNAAHNQWRQQGSQALGQMLGENVKSLPTNTGHYFAGQVPGAVVKTAVTGPIKLGISGVEGAVQTIKTGGAQNASGKTYHLPVIGNVKSFQSEANDRADAGQNPFVNGLVGGLDVAGAGADTVGLAQGGSKLLNMGEKFLAGQAEKKAAKETLDLLQPAMNKKLAINTLKQSGKAGAGAEETGLLGTIKPKVTPKMESIAADVQGLIAKNKTPVENISNINGEIHRISEQELKPALQANKTLIKNTTVMERLNQLEPTRLIKSDATLNNTYDQVKNLASEKIAQFSKDAESIDSESLWNARKQFDQEVEQQFGEAVYNPEKNSAVKSAVRDIRSQMNDIIGEINPEYRPQLKKLNSMYTARDTIAENNYKVLTGEAGKFAKFKANHPTTYKTAKYGAEVLGAGAAYEGAKKLIGH